MNNSKSSKKKSRKTIIRLLETDKGHWYHIKNDKVPDGVDLPSSTNILEAFPAPGLKYWLENTSPEEIKQKQDNGKIQGSKFHHLAYLLSLGERVTRLGVNKDQLEKLPLETRTEKPKDRELLEYLQQPLTKRESNCLIGFENFWDEFKPITKAREIMVFSLKHGFAGTLDWAGYLWNKKKNKYEFWLLDYKISNQHDKKNESQIASYLRAVSEMRGKALRARLGLLYVGKPTKKKFQLKEVEDKKAAFQAFLNTKKLWEYTNPNAAPKFDVMQDEYQVNTEYKTRGKIKLLN